MVSQVQVLVHQAAVAVVFSKHDKKWHEIILHRFILKAGVIAITILNVRNCELTIFDFQPYVHKTWRSLLHGKLSLGH